MGRIFRPQGDLPGPFVGRARFREQTQARSRLNISIVLPTPPTDIYEKRTRSADTREIDDISFDSHDIPHSGRTSRLASIQEVTAVSDDGSEVRWIYFHAIYREVAFFFILKPFVRFRALIVGGPMIIAPHWPYGRGGRLRSMETGDLWVLFVP